MNNRKSKLQFRIQKVLKVGSSSTTFASCGVSARKEKGGSSMFGKLYRSARKSGAGFTLVELIVSLGLFIVVMMISTGAMLSLSDMSRKVQSMRIATDNLNLALESMLKEIRMGTVYHCDYTELPINITRDCGGENSIAFLAQDGSTTVYRINGTVIERSKDGGGTFSSITAPEINIQYLNFYVSGAEGAGGNQPRVLINLGGTAGAKVMSEFKIQTTITQRAPDL